jgi:alcohol dehydrogenase class IV
MTSPVAFALTLPGRIRFGRGEVAAAVPDLAALGARPVLLHAPSAAAAAARLRAALREAGAAPHVHMAPRGEPDLPGLIAALDALRPVGADAVIALGGGAALDMGKALAALLPDPGDPLEHLEVAGRGLPLDRAPLPYAAIPTTAGTGAEATVNAVIGIPEAGRKVSLRDPRLMARLAVVDPALSEGAPAPVRLASGLDAVAQAIEPYLSTRAGPLTDALLRDAIPRGLSAIRRVAEAPGPAAADDMALVALVSGVALANAGLGAVHGLAGVIGGRTGAPHGAICGRLLAPVLRANLAAMAGPRPAELRGWIGAAFDATPDAALDAMEGWIDARGLPRLAAMGVDRADHAAIAAAALTSSSGRTNPVPLSEADLRAILAAA